MGGRPLDTARALVVEALHRMGPEDTFQVIGFDSAAEMMSPTPLPNTHENIVAAEKWLGVLRGSGGTEMMRGITTALSPASDPKRLRMVVFCTDGFIGNEAQIIQYIDEHRNGARVFGFGIGSSVNRYLIDGVARAGRGAADVVGYTESIDEAVTRLYKRLDRPLLTDLSLSFDGITASELQPERLPDLFAGQPLVVVGKYAGAGPATVTLTGLLGSKPYQRKLKVELARPNADEKPVLGTLWARRHIEELSFRTPYQPRPEDVEAITQLGLRFHLITAYTSFVAVERELLADANLPLTQVLVPNEMPEGSFNTPVASNVEALPSRVKPGDPEIRVRAPATARRVEVSLPFEQGARRALFDPTSGEFVLRFLVPPAWPDGSYEAKVAILHEDGHTEAQGVPIRVDTTPAAVAVLSQPDRVMPGQKLGLSLKPALPLGKVVELAGKDSPGGLGNALKGAMEVREILVRAPWGEISRARMQGALGAYDAELTVPATWPAGPVTLEVVASDAAGNISRRSLDVEVGGEQSPMAAASLGLASAALLLAAALWRRAMAPAPRR
jgi:Ca-activated chloride channel family protein